MEQTLTARNAESPSLWHRISSAAAQVLTEMIFRWCFPMPRGLYGTHSDDHTLIVGIDPNGNDLVLQGFNYTVIPGLIQNCVKTHRMENPDYFVGVLDLRTGEVDWS
jgi:hypothetical protein